MKRCKRGHAFFFPKKERENGKVHYEQLLCYLSFKERYNMLDDIYDDFYENVYYDSHSSTFSETGEEIETEVAITPYSLIMETPIENDSPGKEYYYDYHTDMISSSNSTENLQVDMTEDDDSFDIIVSSDEEEKERKNQICGKRKRCFCFSLLESK